jgi:hypothetical protein
MVIFVNLDAAFAVTTVEARPQRPVIVPAIVVNV